MANSVSLPKHLEHLFESIRMSNGLTAVFIEVLTISGSMLADTNRERELTIWLAQQDQAIVGIGTVGFSLDDMPWTMEHFDQEKAFMIAATENAMKEAGWDRLGYEPRKDWVVECLEKFKLMLEAFRREDVVMSNYLKWSEIEEGDDNPTIPFGYPRCSKHEVYLSCHGCILCNNGS